MCTLDARTEHKLGYNRCTLNCTQNAYMATFTRLPSGKWRVQVRSKGVYRGSTFKLKSEARAWAASIESQVGQQGLIVTKATLGDLIDRYMDEMVGGAGKSRNLRLLKRELGHIRLDQLRQLHIEQWAKDRVKTVAASTVAFYLSHLNTVLAYGRDDRKLDIPDGIAKAVRSGLRRTGHDTATRRRERLPTQDELDRLYKHWAGSRTKMPMEEITRFAIGSCMRVAEITRITYEDLDRSAKTIIIRQRKNPKQKMDEVVPLIGEAWEILKDKAGTGRIYPYRSEAISRNFAIACEATGVEDLHFHDLRHAGITQLFQMGLSIQLVAIVSGHKSWEHLKRYTQLTAADVHGALKGK